MTTIQERGKSIEPAETETDAVEAVTTTPKPKGKAGRGRLAVGAIAIAAVAGVAGWQAPNAVGAMTKPPYLGQNADKVATALGCGGYTRAAKHDNAVYNYRDQGTCVINGAVVTITTFDKVSDAHTFEAVMQAVIPVLHPTWSGATYAAGEGWNVADARNLTAAIADLAVQRLADGATHVIPAGTAA